MCACLWIYYPESATQVSASASISQKQDQLAALEKLRKQKTRIINMLGTLQDHEWVTTLLKKYMTDKDDTIMYEAEKALQKTQANSLNASRMREAYKNRSKD